MELIDIDSIQPQPFQAALNRAFKMFGTGVVRPLRRADTLPSTFGGDHDSLRIGGQSLSDDFFGNIGAVGIGGVDEIHAEFDRPS